MALHHHAAAAAAAEIPLRWLSHHRISPGAAEPGQQFIPKAGREMQLHALHQSSFASSLRLLAHLGQALHYFAARCSCSRSESDTAAHSVALHFSEEESILERESPARRPSGTCSTLPLFHTFDALFDSYGSSTCRVQLLKHCSHARSCLPAASLVPSATGCAFSAAAVWPSMYL